MNLGSFFQLEQQVQRAVIIALLVALGLSLLGGVGGTLWYRSEAATARAEATRCSGDLAVSQANVATLKNANASQNRMVDAFKAEADARVKAAEEAVKKAEGQARKNEDRARAILATKPSRPDDPCGSALDLYQGRVRK